MSVMTHDLHAQMICKRHSLSSDFSSDAAGGGGGGIVLGRSSLFTGGGGVGGHHDLIDPAGGKGGGLGIRSLAHGSSLGFDSLLGFGCWTGVCFCFGSEGLGGDASAAGFAGGRGAALIGVAAWIGVAEASVGAAFDGREGTASEAFASSGAGVAPGSAFFVPFVGGSLSSTTIAFFFALGLGPLCSLALLCSFVDVSSFLTFLAGLLAEEDGLTSAPSFWFTLRFLSEGCLGDAPGRCVLQPDMAHE